MDETLLEQEVENIRSEVVSKFFIEYVGFLIVISLLTFILPLFICPFLAFLLTSIWGITFLFVLSMFFSLYACMFYSQQKIISRIKNLFLNTGLVYENIKVTKNTNPNNVLERLVELDLDHNYISLGNMYNLVHKDYNEIVYLGLVYLSKMNYNSYTSYYRSDSPKYRSREFKYVILSGLSQELLYEESSNIKTGIVFVVPESLFDSEKAKKQGIKHRKVENSYVVLIDDEYMSLSGYNDIISGSHNKLETDKQQKISINIFKKIDKHTILKIMESTLREIVEIINIVKGKGIIKCL